ncbi:MAG: hypothetical protein K6F69_06075 [Treponema sp.]|nr:hypothetical protein [Treponema sp.]
MSKKESRDYTLILKANNLTEKQQTKMIMESRSIVNRIAPKSRTIVGIEKKER